MGRIEKQKRQLIEEANMRLLNEQEDTQLWRQVVNKVGESEFNKIGDKFATIGDINGIHITVGQSVDQKGDKYTYAIGIDGKVGDDKSSVDAINNILSKLDQSKRQETYREEDGIFKFHPLTDVDSVVNVIKELKNKLGL